MDREAYQKTRAADQSHEVIALRYPGGLLNGHRGSAAAPDNGLTTSIPRQVSNLAQVVTEQYRICRI